MTTRHSAQQSAALSSSSSTASSKPRRRKLYPRDQLVKSLQILDVPKLDLPPTLPPSPPASRSASPALGSKRRAEPIALPPQAKRSRADAAIDKPSHSHQQPVPRDTRLQSAAVSAPARNEPCEDGEVREELPVASSSRAPAPVPAASVASAVPIRRPRKGRPSPRHFDAIHEKYHNAGRLLKYSGDARFWSTYSPTHKEYRPLADPPPPNSPYHKYGGLIARLELVDALVCFTYAIWNKDYGRKHCSKDTWATIEAFLVWCKQKWTAEEGISDAEKAFVGLIWMIEAFIQSRKLVYTVRSHLDHDMDRMTDKCKTAIGKAAADADANPHTSSNGSLLAPSSHATPPMLPSPASIAPASANSTPVSRAGDTPNNISRSASASAQPPPRPLPPTVLPPSIPGAMLPNHLNGAVIPDHVIHAMASVVVPIRPALAQQLKESTAGVNAAGYCLYTAQSTLNLPNMARLYPNTFARMIHSSLLHTEEHEPDFEDEEGELLWPGQAITGEGLGWVCLMGKAMILEFGKAYGYRGLDGVVPKPKIEEEGEVTSGTPGHSSMLQHPHARSQPPQPHPLSSSTQR